jgi:DNA-binding MarR family transcriptional regulator
MIFTKIYESDKILLRELGPTTFTYLCVILSILKKKNTTELHISYPDLCEYIDETYYNTRKSLSRLERHKLLEIKKGGHGNINLYKLTEKSLKLYAAL